MAVQSRKHAISLKRGRIKQELPLSAYMYNVMYELSIAGKSDDLE